MRPKSGLSICVAKSRRSKPSTTLIQFAYIYTIMQTWKLFNYNHKILETSYEMMWALHCTGCDVFFWLSLLVLWELQTRTWFNGSSSNFPWIWGWIIPAPEKHLRIYPHRDAVKETNENRWPLKAHTWNQLKHQHLTCITPPFKASQLAPPAQDGLSEIEKRYSPECCVL